MLRSAKKSLGTVLSALGAISMLKFHQNKLSVGTNSIWTSPSVCIRRITSKRLLGLYVVMSA